MSETPEPAIYQLKVLLLGISPMIWRRLLVCSTSTITDFHHILRITMGWSDNHLHMFRIHGKQYGPYSLMAMWPKTFLETFVLDRAKVAARVLASTGRGPDVFVGLNEWIEETYAILLHRRCSLFMKNGNFDREKAFRISTTEDGKIFLKIQ